MFVFDLLILFYHYHIKSKLLIENYYVTLKKLEVCIESSITVAVLGQSWKIRCLHNASYNYLELHCSLTGIKIA